MYHEMITISDDQLFLGLVGRVATLMHLIEVNSCLTLTWKTLSEVRRGEDAANQKLFHIQWGQQLPWKLHSNNTRTSLAVMSLGKLIFAFVFTSSYGINNDNGNGFFHELVG